MAQDEKRGDTRGEMRTNVTSVAAATVDDATLMKKRARRRLIGAAALALLAAIVLPMAMDHEPATSLQDIQVRIPSPDEGVTQRVAPRPAESPPVVKDAVPAPPPDEAPKPIAKPAESPKPPAEAAKPSTPTTAVDEIKRAEDALAGRLPVEQWEVQLGAYQNSASVANLVRKLKELGIPTYTEKVDTPNGPRTRVRAGPFPTQEAAERARARVKIVGVDGPVARKP